MSKKAVKEKYFLESSNFRVLNKDVASDNKELIRIAEEAGIVYPNHDHSVIKCIYACLEKANLNGAILTRSEIESKLDTIKHKPLNINHIQSKVVGHFIKAEIEDDKIIAYAVFYKEIFLKEYAMFKELTESGKGRVSFEMWAIRKDTVKDIDGNIIQAGENEYFNTNIELCGGAILRNKTPAEEEAHVLEMASLNMETFYDILYTVKCPVCYSSWNKILIVEFINNTLIVECVDCGSIYSIEVDTFVTLLQESASKNRDVKVKNIKVIANSYLEYEEAKLSEKLFKMDNAIDLTAKERKELSDKSFAVIQRIKDIKGKVSKIRRFPINDEKHIEIAIKLLSLATDLSKEEKEKALKRINKKAKELSMDNILMEKKTIGETEMDELKKLKTQIETLESAKAETEKATVDLQKEISDLKEQLLTKDKIIEEAKSQSEELKEKIEAFETVVAEKVEKAKKEAVVVTQRRAELGDFASDLSDEQILTDIVYENATLKKQLAETEAKIKNVNLKKSTATKADKIVGSHIDDTTETKSEYEQLIARAMLARERCQKNA